MTRRIRTLLLVILFAQAFAFAGPRLASAGGVSADEIAGAVNALRAAQGLPAYSLDGGLTSYAQQHSEYQASINTATHQHSDGTTPWQHGLDENIAMGMSDYITVDFVIYQVWSDAVHMKTMVGYGSGSMGVGVASANGNTFITLEVRPGSGGAPVSPPQPGGEGGAPSLRATSIPIAAVLTATPDTDGVVVHTVGYGQSLWAIAIGYGVKIADIRRLNNLPENSTTINTGQKLIINPGHITPSPTPRPLTPIEMLTPSSDGKYYHEVKNGETVSGIAQWYGVRVDELQAWNGLTNASIIRPGQKLILQVTPPATATPTPGPATATPMPHPTQTASPVTMNQLTSLPTQMRTETPTATAPQPQVVAVEGLGKPQVIGIAIVGLCVGGLALIGLGLRRRGE